MDNLGKLCSTSTTYKNTSLLKRSSTVTIETSYLGYIAIKHILLILSTTGLYSTIWKINSKNVYSYF